MYIKNILYFSKEDAEVSISDGSYTVNCYVYPVNSISVNKYIKGVL